MVVNTYINFNGNCREAIECYERTFETEKPQIMTFGDMPSDPQYPLPDDAKDLIMHTFLNICGTTIMFSDIFPGTPYVIRIQWFLYHWNTFINLTMLNKYKKLSIILHR